MYFDFIQNDGNIEKLNAIEITISKKYCGDKNALTMLEMQDPDNNIEFITESYTGNFYYPIFWLYDQEYLESIAIPEFVLDSVVKQKAKILIVNIYEGHEISGLIQEFLLERYYLSFENIVVMNGNKFKIDGIASVYNNYWENIIASGETSQSSMFNKAYNLVFSKNNYRKHKFICLQRRPKPYRLALYTELYPFRKQGILTMGRGDYGTDGYYNFYKSDIFNKQYAPSYKKFKKNNLVSTLPAVYDVDVSVINPAFDEDDDKFYSAYLHVVPETFFETTCDKEIFFSEKIFKPVIYFQPFVMFNQYNTLSQFRSLGYETFSEIIDESYDEIVDDETRFYSAVKSTINFINHNEKTLSKIMKKVFPIMAHNFYNLVSTVNTNQTRIKSELISLLYN